MAPDLLSTIGKEIDARLAELRPLVAEHEQLLVAARAFETQQAGPASGKERRGAALRSGPRRAATGPRSTRGSAAGAIERAASATSAPGSSGAPGAARPSRTPRTRAQRGAAREAILAALEHGSHTVSELVVVTAMSAANVNGNVRRLLTEGVIARTEREGKPAYALAQPVPSA